MTKTNIITVANQKGGVGKTTTVVNLASSYASIGKKVLVIDMDVQANATTALGLEKPKEGAQSIASAIQKRLTFDKVLCSTQFGIDIVCGSRKLDDLVPSLIGTTRKFKLVEQLLDTKKINLYDIVLIDTHPSLDMYFQSAMAASHYYLIPLFAEAFSVSGLVDQINAIEDIRFDLNKMLTSLGVVICNFNQRDSVHVDFEKIIRALGKKAGFRILNTTIPNSTAVKTSQMKALPLNHYKPKLPVTLAYSTLAGELLPELRGKRIGRRVAPVDTNAIRKSHREKDRGVVFEESLEF
ncbi:MAG: ParA family protein [Oligoflexales bacterium]